MQAEPARKLLLSVLLFVGTSVLLAQDAPDEAFLMYLSDYEKIDGEWIDPGEFAQQLEKMAEMGKAEKTAEKPAEVVNEKRS
jgi:hypothetical protein